MFGYRFIKVQPTQYVLQYRGGKPQREGAGLSFFYFAPTSSLVLVPTASVNEPFIFEEVTSDFQDITIQGQITYRIADPRRTATMLNFTLDARGRYVSEDPQKLAQRLIDQVRVAMRADLRSMTLQQALSQGEEFVARVTAVLSGHPTVEALGVEVLGLSVLAIKPKPETARALEAEAREALLGRADEAAYGRRNAAVEQERAIKENELNTEIAVEAKQRQIQETKMDAERALGQRRYQIESENMAGKVAIEQQRAALVAQAATNAKTEADARAYGIAAMMGAFAGADAKVLQALASVGMKPDQLMALAFRDMAENAGKIGTLNITPDLLTEILKPKGKA